MTLKARHGAQHGQCLEGEQAGGTVSSAPWICRAGSATAERLPWPLAGKAAPCLLPAHLTSHPRWGHPQLQQRSTLSLPVLAAFPFNKFPVSKKIHKTQFLEVNNSETLEKETKTETSSVPNGHEEHAVAGACLLHVAPWAPHGAQWHTGLSLKTTII